MFIKTYIVTAKTNPDIFYEVDAPCKWVARWCGATLANYEYAGKIRTARDMTCKEGILMITAAQAKEKTLEKITQIAKEFITNCAEPAIDEAVAEGKFKATPSFEGVPNPEITGAEVVKLLEEQGFEAEHVCYDNVNGYANYIRIKWEGD